MSPFSRVVRIEAKQLIGMQQSMSLVDNKTFMLFSSFMPRRAEIVHPLSQDIYDLKEYPQDYFSNFSPNNTFTKWALMEVNDLGQIPEGMQTYQLAAGLYAVFIHKGLSSDTSTFRYIFDEWLPNSTYKLDHRPHFDVLGAKTKRNDPDSEEEIWIPIK